MRNNNCAGCGKKIGPGEITMRVARGKMGQRGAFNEEKEWGLLHQACFDRAVDNPDALFKAIQEQAAEG
jgi:hypothetical protein